MRRCPLGEDERGPASVTCCVAAGSEFPQRVASPLCQFKVNSLLQAQYLDSSPHPHPLAARRMRVEREVTFQPVEGLRPTFVCPTNS